MNRLLVLCFSTFVCASLNIAVQLNRSDPKAQMDETCHFPQASLYCNGIYDQITSIAEALQAVIDFMWWSPVITTLPGLYIFSVGPLKILQTFMDIPCSVFTLRMFNLIVNSLSFIFIHYIVSHYHSFICERKRMLVTLTLAIFPLNYFFTFLYYTDPLSTSFILLMHLMWLWKSYNLSALAGFSAVLTRQTSIVWVFFHAMLTINEIYNSSTKSNCIPDINNNTSKQTSISNKKKLTRYEENKKFVNYIRNSYIVLQGLLKETLVKTGGYLLVGLLFIAFVYVNNGIVVGDRESHTVNANFPQLLYFTLFTGILTLPHLISQYSQIVSFAGKHKLLTCLICIVSALIVHFNTVAHHYNLGDSHHFTHHFLNFVFYNPVYAQYNPVYIIQNSIRSFGKLMATVFILVLAVNLIPQLLLEFRYYVPGFLIFRMRMVSRKWEVLLSEFAIYFFINLVTIYLYIGRPVLFPEDGDHQIIMW